MKNSMRLRLQSLTALVGIVSVALSTPSMATDAWTGSFTISSIFVSPPGNYYFRVYGMPSQASMCPNGPNWGYIEMSDSGYQVYVSALLAAYSAGTPVYLHVVADSGGYCHISEMHT